MNIRPVGADRRTDRHDEANSRGELSYLAPLGSENISAPYSTASVV